MIEKYGGMVNIIIYLSLLQESDVSAAKHPPVNHDKYIIRLWEPQQSRQ